MYKKAKIMEHLTPTATPARTPTAAPAMAPARTPTAAPAMALSCPSGGSIFMNEKCVCLAGTTKKTIRLPMASGNLSYCE